MEKHLVKGKDRKICGVCSGIADYFGWDVTIVRIVCGVLSVCYGFGLIAYIVGALVMPNE